MGSCIRVTTMASSLVVFAIMASSSSALPQSLQPDDFTPSLIPLIPLIHVFNISLTRGCLQCGSSCLSTVQRAVPGCVAAGLLDAGPSLFKCVKDVIGAASSCRECLASLVCCVTDSCKYVLTNFLCLTKFNPAIAPVTATTFSSFLLQPLLPPG